jgi:putative sulfotransferase
VESALDATVTPRFIVSTGRCGSTLLSTLLGQHSSVLSVSELFAAVQPRAFPPGEITGERFWAILSEPQAIWTVALRHRLEAREFLYPVDAGKRFDRQTGVPPIACVCLPAIVDDADALYSELERAVPRFPAAQIAVHYRLLFAWLVERLGKHCWVERSGGSLQYVGQLADRFPGAKFLHLYRDGRETALSMSRHTFFRMRLAWETRAAALGRDPSNGESESGDTSLPNELDGLLPEGYDPRTLWQLPIPIERFGRRWSAMILLGMHRLASLPRANVRHLSYESLVGDPESHLRDLLAFFELPEPPPDWFDSACAQVEYRPPHRPELSAEDEMRLQRACAVGERRLRDLAAS